MSYCELGVGWVGGRDVRGAKEGEEEGKGVRRLPKVTHQLSEVFGGVGVS